MSHVTSPFITISQCKHKTGSSTQICHADHSRNVIASQWDYAVRHLVGKPGTRALYKVLPLYISYFGIFSETQNSDWYEELCLVSFIWHQSELGLLERTLWKAEGVEQKYIVWHREYSGEMYGKLNDTTRCATRPQEMHTCKTGKRNPWDPQMNQNAYLHLLVFFFNRTFHKQVFCACSIVRIAISVLTHYFLAIELRGSAIFIQLFWPRPCEIRS